MKRILLFVLACYIFNGLNAQKVLSMAKIDHAAFRIVKLKLKKEDKYQCQKLVNKKWTVLFTKDIPSEGMRFADANNDGYLDVVLQYRWAQEVYIFSEVKNGFHDAIQIGYDGFTPFEKGKHLFYSFFSTKYEYGYEAKLYFVNSKTVKLVASVEEIAASPTEKADSLVYTITNKGKTPFKTIVGQNAINNYANSFNNDQTDYHYTWYIFFADYNLFGL